MNNNGFVLMRYLRDLGADAHLLLYANDGKGSLSHFSPENDTWCIEKWQPFIHQTAILNSPYAGLDGVYIAVDFLHALIGRIQGREGATMHWKPASTLRKALDGYDFYVGSGIAPALFGRLGKVLDVYYPYATGVEQLGAQELTSQLPHMGFLKKYFTLKAMVRQREGIARAGLVFNSEFSLTKEVLAAAGITFHPLAIPMVYRGPAEIPTSYSPMLNSALAAIGSRKFILSFARQLWVKPLHMKDEEWRRESKNSDWLLRAFGRLCQERPRHGLLLVLAEYGPDVGASKSLCHKLGIGGQVLWLPKMGRKELSIITERAYVIAGEFKDVEEMIWGGTGWEALAAARPLIHSFRFSAGRYEQLYGVPCPPVLPVVREADVYELITKLLDDPELVASIGAASGDWFQRHNGIGLARQWLDLLVSRTATAAGSQSRLYGNATHV